MYYEANPKQQRKRRRRRGCLSRLFRLALVGVIIWALVALLSGQMIQSNLFSGDQPALQVNNDLPRGYTNILLLGCDKETGGGSRSDAIMVASVGGSGEIKLTSIMRDTMLSMPNNGTHKLNAAYRLGGADLAMATVNGALGLNITKYATIDFEGIAQVIDAMGGIELNITKAEMEQINRGLRGAYKKKRVYNGVLMTPLTEYGKNIHLSGTHAMFYARIRNIDSDYKRAERQRVLLDTMLKKLRNNRNPITIASVGAAVLRCVETNLSAIDISMLGIKALGAGGQIEQYRIPAEGAYTSGTKDGIWSIRPDLEKNKRLLYEFIYG